VLHPAYLKKADINTFSVDRNSDDFKELFKSIERFGVKDPVLARFNKDGDLEILSGQRRHLIASELNYPVPTIIQQLDDDDARILVADGNLHREHISTYDLSRALRMKADSMKRKAGRKLRGVKGGPETDELIAKEMGMSTMKLNRLMKLSEATQQICDLVDDGTIAVSIAYNIAFLQPEHQDTVADLIGINVKVNNENTTNLKKIAAKESLTEQKIRDVLEGKYPPKVVEKPKAVEPPAPAVQPMAPAPAAIPKSPDVGAPVPGQPADKVIPFPASEAVPPQPVPAAPAQPTAAAPTVESAPATQTTPTQANNTPPVSAAPEEAPKEAQDRENSYETKIVLRGDRLRKYFPDVSMTPLAIENSIYDALEERRQRQAKEKAKAEIFKGKKEPVK
jgi:ParB/RepB/Spo0J family partition protein